MATKDSSQGLCSLLAAPVLPDFYLAALLPAPFLLSLFKFQGIYKRLTNAPSRDTRQCLLDI
jgi:hypothetical protein